MNVFVTASNSLYRDVCNYNVYCAKHYGKFDKVVVYDVDTDVDETYKQQYTEIFKTKRGAGLWLWKVYFIEKAFREECNEGDILFYADAASFFFRSVKPVINKMQEDIFAVRLPFIENEFTKKETFELMGLNDNRFSNTNQYHASFMAFRKNNNTLTFIEEWKKCCEDIRLLSPDVCFGQQIPSFIAHRNDQSIFSLLCKKYNIMPSEDPSQYGVTGYGHYKDASYIPLKSTEAYPICILLHKQRTLSDMDKIKYWLKIYKRYIIMIYRQITKQHPLI